MYHRLFSGCMPIIALQLWPMRVASQWGLREPLTQPPPSSSPSTLCAHPMEGNTPASQLLIHLHQQWMPQEMWLPKVSIAVKSIVWEEWVFRELDISLLERCKWQMCKLAYDIAIASSLKVLFQTQQSFEVSLTVSHCTKFYIVQTFASWLTAEMNVPLLHSPYIYTTTFVTVTSKCLPGLITLLCYKNSIEHPSSLDVQFWS